MKDFLKSLLGVIFWLAILTGEVCGLIHSFKKHDIADGIAAVVIPPFAIYRGLESLWHDDNKDVDWDEVLSYDCEAIITFMNAAQSENVSIVKLNRDINDFAESIESYPKNKIAELQEVATSYTEYYASVIWDICDAFEIWYNDKQPLKVKWSKNTMDLEKKIAQYYEDVSDLREEAEITYNSAFRKMAPDDAAPLDIDILRESLINKSISTNSRTYKKIFGYLPLLGGKFTAYSPTGIED